MKNGKKPLPDKLKEWLNSQGYPLEMAVASEFQKSDFIVSLSDFYKDPETGTSREIDVTALKWSATDIKTPLQVCWRIECKLAHKHPWVVFVSSAQPELPLPLVIFASPVYRSKLVEAMKKEDFQERLRNLKLFRRYVGYGITEAFTTGQDVPYKAIMSAAKASLDRVTGIDNIELEPRLPEKPKYVCVSFPIVVIEGQLFECFSDENGILSPIEVQSSVLFWKGTSPGNSSTLVYVVTKDELPEFVEKVNETTDFLIDAVKS